MKVKEFVLFKKNELLQFCIYRLIFGIINSFYIGIRGISFFT